MSPCSWDTGNFNPRSPHGERRRRCTSHDVNRQFQPTLPARGATGRSAGTTSIRDDFNPRSRTGSDQYLTDKLRVPAISTHAPCTGSDEPPDEGAFLRSEISTHAPRTGSDASVSYTMSRLRKFQPTLPARGATIQHATSCCIDAISTHAPRTGSDKHCHRAIRAANISTHAPRTGSDMLSLTRSTDVSTFQPTLPARGATSHVNAPLPMQRPFQPTLPARGAT